MKQTAKAEVVIIGGGIAGLWLLTRLRQAGRSAILFESKTLGGGQTHKAQGIIHGGMKYALQGVLTNEAEGMSAVPALWRDCLAGKGEIDLSPVSVLSDAHYLWSPSKLGAKITGFLAGAALSSKVSPVTKDHYPLVFQHPQFKGNVYALDEMVIDVHELVRELVKHNQDAIFRCEPITDEGLHLDADGRLQSITVYLSGKAMDVQAKHFVFTAGVGNEVVTRKLNHPGLKMQCRPLHMVMMRLLANYPLYAHCMGLGPRPRLTITTHTMQDGGLVWYLGGQLAEDGIDRSTDQQIKAAKQELAALFPWLDFTQADFATFMIDRAEALQKNGLKPESTYHQTMANVTIAWPTKLALAPKLANDIVREMALIDFAGTLTDTHALRAWPIPCIARPIWEEMFCKSVA